MDLNHKNIILTGASSGIGLALLRELEKYDCRIIAVARTIEKIKIENPGTIKYPCDISVEKNIDALFDYAVKEMGCIDIFIANAGFTYYGLCCASGCNDIESIYSTNVISPLYAAIRMKQLNKERPFRFVVTASAMSFLSYPGYAVYASTKAALHGFASGYRLELARGQNIQLVYPIATKTNFFEEAGEKTPVPWPTQTPEKVALTVVKGIKKNRNSIFPSKIFLSLLVLNRLFPFIFRLIVFIEKTKFYRWLRSSAG